MNIKKEISLSAIAKTEDGTPVMTFQARLNPNEPNDISYTPAIMNQGLYRENRDQMEAERKTFEEAMYAEQDRLIAIKEESK